MMVAAAGGCVGTKTVYCLIPPLSVFIRVYPCHRFNSPFDLAVPALGPFVALLVGDVPVDVHELRGALADGRDPELLVVHLGLLVDRAVAVLDREHLLEGG